MAEHKILLDDRSGKQALRMDVCDKITEAMNEIFPDEDYVIQIRIAKNMDDLLFGK